MCEEGGWLKRQITVIYGGGGLKLLKKRYMIFERFLVAILKVGLNLQSIVTL